jgi:hypothetical protein
MNWRWWTTRWLVIQMWCVKLRLFQSSRRHASLYNLKCFTTSTMDNGNGDQSKEKYKSLKILWNKITKFVHEFEFVHYKGWLFQWIFKGSFVISQKNIFNKIIIDTTIPKTINKFWTSFGAFDEIMSSFL